MSLNGLIEDLQVFCKSMFGVACQVTIKQNIVHIHLSDNNELTFRANDLSDVRYWFTMFKMGKRNTIVA